jgi:hypothetical protein
MTVGYAGVGVPWYEGGNVRGAASVTYDIRGTDMPQRLASGREARGWCGGPLEGAHSTHTTSTGRQGRLGRKGAVARRGHGISKADVRS